MRHPSKLGKHVIEEEETEFGSPTAFDFQASTATDFQTSIIHSQLRVVNNAFVIDKLYLMSLNLQKTKKKKKRNSYHATFKQKEKDHVKRKLKEKMHELQKHILFFDFIENYYVSKKFQKTV